MLVQSMQLTSDALRCCPSSVAVKTTFRVSKNSGGTHIADGTTPGATKYLEFEIILSSDIPVTVKRSVSSLA